MNRKIIYLILLIIPLSVYSQETAFNNFLADTTTKHALITLCIADIENGRYIYEYNSGKSITPASVLKLVTTSIAMELLGPEYVFRTTIGYTGEIKSKSGKLNGDIVITGGGDPTLGSKEFSGHYGNFIERWIDEIKKAGIRNIEGRILTDDSYYDYQPVPAKWLWEDIGNYYGAGAYGLSIYDNTCEIHYLTSSDSLYHIITGVYPEECLIDLEDRLTVYGTKDEGYVFAAPYTDKGWIEGSIPANKDDFVLKASVPDPPLLMARLIDKKLRTAGIRIKGKPSTVRLEGSINIPVEMIAEINSPALKDIIEVLNHESVNLYAEHLLKELGKVYKDNGSTSAGIDIIKEFFNSIGILSNGMFVEDGSGLSRSNALNAEDMVKLLIYLKKDSKHFDEFYSSLPDAGREGTLKDYFKDNTFESRLVAKSGSMNRVRSYAGYLKTISGNELAFCIIVNNFTGPSRDIVSHIEDILKETILTK